MAALVEQSSGGLTSLWRFDDGNHEDGEVNEAFMVAHSTPLAKMALITSLDDMDIVY